MRWWDQMMLSFKPTFSLSSFTFIKRLYSSSSLSAIGVVSSAYLRLLIFLPAVLIPACASSSPAFLMMYSAYKLNKQGDNTQPWRTPFPIWNQSVVPCPILTGASWPAYRFLKRQVRWSGIPVSFRIFHSLLPTVFYQVMRLLVNCQGLWVCRSIPKKKKCKKAKWFSDKSLEIAVKRSERKRRKRYAHLNAELQRIARRDKKAFLSDKWKEIEENNRMGRLEISSRKLEVPREHFMQIWAQ